MVAYDRLHLPGLLTAPELAAQLGISEEEVLRADFTAPGFRRISIHGRVRFVAEADWQDATRSRGKR